MLAAVPWINLALSIIYIAVGLMYIITHRTAARWFMAVSIVCVAYIGVVFLLVILGMIQMVHLWVNLYGPMMLLLLSILTAHVLIKR